MEMSPLYIHFNSSDSIDDEDKTFTLPALRGDRERKPSAIIYTKKRKIYTAGVC